jgi:hypothetical protein
VTHAEFSLPDQDGRRAALSARRYLFAVLAAGGATLVAVLLFLVIVDRSGHLPPPAFTNSLCVDEKIKFLRDRAPAAPTLIAAGSSVALFNFAGEPFVAASGGATVPLNLGLCGLRMNQVEFASERLLDHYPTTTSVLVFVASEDFRDCTSAPTPFAAADVTDYIERRRPQYFYYLKYFSPVSFLRNMRKVAAGRTGSDPDSILAFDRFGGFHSKADRGLSYATPETLEEACFVALHRLAQALSVRPLEAVVVISPVHPGWSAKFDEDGIYRREFRERLRAALTGTRLRIWDADAEARLGPAHFTDALHLNQTGAEALARQMVATRIADGASSRGAAPHARPRADFPSAALRVR